MIVILNRSAGTAAGKPDETADEVKSHFATKGVEVEIVHPDEQHDLSALARDAVAKDGETIVAGGGDGTISAVAGALADTGKTLGVLPLGTLNHFAKDLGIPLGLEQAIAIIVAGHTAIVDMAEVNGRTFINNSSLGIYPEVVADREEQQEEKSRGKWVAFAWASVRAFRRFPFLHLKIKIEGKELNRKTPFLFIGNNEYEMAGLNLGARRCVNAGKLGLYLTHRTGRLGLFRLAFRALFGRLQNDKDFDAFCVEEATIETRRPRLLVATDGEVNEFETPLHYRVRPGALRVHVPQDAAK